MADYGFRRRWMLAVGALAAVLIVMVAGLGLTRLVPSLNPFGTETVDRTHPALLQSMRDLSQYHAAVGDFQVIVDVEKDVKFVPAAIAGQRSLFVAAGTVNAYVDFSNLTEDALKVSPESKTVEVRLPAPALDKPNLDPERSYLVSQQRGIWNRLNDLIGAPTDQQEFYVVAEQKISEAASASKLADRAEQNTRAMLTGMLHSLGYQVTFATDSG
jgi:hypothetical protein